MGRARAILVAVAVQGSIACGSGTGATPSSPTPTPPVQATPAPPGQQRVAIAFSGLAGDGTPVTSYTESGFTILVTTGSWQAGANYGNPRPFIRFQAQPGTTAVGEIQVTAAGDVFGFQSVDLYASTTPIPYAIAGLRSSATVFALTDTLPNTFGQFRTVQNPNATLLIDTLKITLANSAAPCCGNPMGLDNIALVR